MSGIRRGSCIRHEKDPLVEALRQRLGLLDGDTLVEDPPAAQRQRQQPLGGGPLVADPLVAAQR